MNFELTFKPMYIGRMACDYYGSRAKGGFGIVITEIAPSSIPSVVYREPVNEYTTEQVHELVNSYIDSAVRCKQAGFDGVEFHSAHGYMGLQFMSPRTNKRIDEFGGGISGRAGGIEEEEAIVFVRLFESYGADALNVSAGTYASWDVIVPPTAWQQGWN
ncbi:MAG: hypothetical protein WDA24_01660 [Tissierellales bacterium]